MNLGRLFLLIMVFIGFSQISQADDFYYNGGEVYNPYNGLTVMNLPPPPPMKDVPFYVRDDYDDYVEDYYECILGYEYKGMVCRYWRKYAEKHGLYKKLQNQQNNGNVVNNQNNTPYIPNSGNGNADNNTAYTPNNENNQNPNGGYYGPDGAYYPAGNNQGNGNNNQNINQNNNNNNVLVPYTPNK